MFRTKHCHHSNACSASCISSWFTEASQLRTAKSEFWKTTDTSLSPISTSNWPLSSLSLELSFLSLLPLPGYPLSLRQPPVACCFQVTMPMSELPSMHFPQQRRGHLAKTQGWPTFPLPKTPRSHHLAQWFSQGMVVPPGVRFGNLGMEVLVATVIGRSLLWVKAKPTQHLQYTGQTHKETPQVLHNFGKSHWMLSEDEKCL